MELAMFILAIVGTAATVYGVLNKEKIKQLFIFSKNRDNVKKQKNKSLIISLLIEPKEPARLYRATRKNASYLLLNIMLVNTSNEIIVIRKINAIMSDEIGAMQLKNMNVIATHKGLGANYSLGITENLIPLSITGNSSKDAYIAFEFQNCNIITSNVLISIVSSKGNITIPLGVEVIG